MGEIMTLLAVEQNSDDPFEQLDPLCLESLYGNKRMIRGTHGEVGVVFVL